MNPNYKLPRFNRLSDRLNENELRLFRKTLVPRKDETTKKPLTSNQARVNGK